MTPPKVSIVIPIKNRARLFADTAASLIGQTHREWEAIVVDDGSSSAEFTRIAEVAAIDPRIRLMPNPGPRSGACACRNAGAAASSGEYVIFLDSDDALSPQCLAHRSAYLSSHPELDFAVFMLWYFFHAPGDSSALWNVFDGSDDIARFLSCDAPWQTCSPIWRRAALERFGGWDTRVRTWQDGDFHLRALVDELRYDKVAVADAFWRAPTALGSIGSGVQKPLHVMNRIRAVGRIAMLLRASGKLDEHRRRIISAQFFSHAFRTRLTRRRSLAIWRHGRTIGIVSSREFVLGWLIDAFQRATRRLAQRSIKCVFPELDPILRYGLHQHAISAADLPPAAKSA